MCAMFILYSSCFMRLESEIGFHKDITVHKRHGPNRKKSIIEYLHMTVKSTSAFNGVCDIMLLASHRKRALLSFASAVNE